MSGQPEPEVLSPLLKSFVNSNYVVVHDMDEKYYLHVDDIMSLFKKTHGEAWGNQMGYYALMSDLTAQGIKAIGLRVSLMAKSAAALQHHGPPPSPAKQDTKKTEETAKKKDKRVTKDKQEYKKEDSSDEDEDDEWARYYAEYGRPGKRSKRIQDQKKK